MFHTTIALHTPVAYHIQQQQQQQQQQQNHAIGWTPPPCLVPNMYKKYVAITYM